MFQMTLSEISYGTKKAHKGDDPVTSRNLVEDKTIEATSSTTLPDEQPARRLLLHLPLNVLASQSAQRKDERKTQGDECIMHSTSSVCFANVLFKNAHFCGHVCHSWLNRSKRALVLTSNGVTRKAEITDYELVQKEALRLEEMLDGLIDGMKRRAQITENKEHLLVFARKSGGRKKRVTWLPSSQQKIRGTWFGLAQSLIEQYSVNLELEDVHEREMRVIIWKTLLHIRLIAPSDRIQHIKSRPRRLEHPETHRLASH
ncbi:hypothetical protein OSTOST_16109 [Ostertagia ostertagi]